MGLQYVVDLDPSGNRPDQGLPEGGYGGGRPDNSLPGGQGGVVAPPIYFPTLPGIYPPVKPGEPTLPIALPPTIWPPRPGHGLPKPPVFIGGTPENPIELPPGIYPPLPPGLPPSGKVAILVFVLGSGTVHWIVVDAAQVSPPIAATPSPK